MKGKTIIKSLIVAIITTLGVIIAVSFQGCVATTASAPVQVNTCDIVTQSKILGSIGAFIFSFVSSLIAFGWKEKSSKFCFLNNLFSKIRTNIKRIFGTHLAGF